MLLTYHSDDTHAKALSSDSPLKVSGAIVCDSLMTVICVCVCVHGWISEGRRHEHREHRDRHREKYVGPSNPACMFSGCNLTAEGCVCESQSCHHHFAYINRSQCQEAAGNL